MKTEISTEIKTYFAEKEQALTYIDEHVDDVGLTRLWFSDHYWEAGDIRYEVIIVVRATDPVNFNPNAIGMIEK